MWFNPSELSKTELTPLATSATFATFEEKSSKTLVESRKVAKVAEGKEQKNLIVTCYTPAGNPVQVEARDDEHAAWLLKMNLEPIILTP